MQSRTHREDQGQRARQGGASLQSRQTPVWTREGALPWVGKEHEPVAGDVRVEQPVDGAQGVDRRPTKTSLEGLGATASGLMARRRGRNEVIQPKNFAMGANNFVS